jgi:hypothetical protein
MGFGTFGTIHKVALLRGAHAGVQFWLSSQFDGAASPKLGITQSAVCSHTSAWPSDEHFWLFLVWSCQAACRMALPQCSMHAAKHSTEGGAHAALSQVHAAINRL